MGHGTYGFHATPQGFVDRESERDAAGFGDRAEKLHVVDVDLNSWFRIDTPDTMRSPSPPGAGQRSSI
jgi:hypothetical protein